jgi:hypothetical protein
MWMLFARVRSSYIDHNSITKADGGKDEISAGIHEVRLVPRGAKFTCLGREGPKSSLSDERYLPSSLQMLSISCAS